MMTMNDPEGHPSELFVSDRSTSDDRLPEVIGSVAARGEYVEWGENRAPLAGRVPARSPQRVQRANAGPARVLFVDHDERTREDLEHLIPWETHGWELGFSTTAEDALARLNRRPCDVIVVDVHLLGRDGFDLVRAMRQDGRFAHIPVVMAAEAGDADLKRRALAAGALDLVEKPFAREELLARIDNSLRIKAQHDDLSAQRQELARAVLDLLGSRHQAFWAIARAAEYRDRMTGQRMARVSASCVAIARALGLDDEFVAALALASPLHDLGKVGVPDHVLSSRGALTSDEWNHMKEHCRIGADILSPDSASPELLRHWDSTLSKDYAQLRRLATAGLGGAMASELIGLPEAVGSDFVLEMASQIALSHHERWDGSGYPHGLAGASIPLAARIVAVADVYDALRSWRPYKPAFSEEDAVATIRQAVGHHFDPEVAAAFERCRDELGSIFDGMPADAGPAAVDAA